MTLPKHPIRTAEDYVELEGFHSFSEYIDLTRHSKSLRHMLSFLGFRNHKPVLQDSASFIKQRNKLAAETFGPRIHRNLPAAFYNTFIKANFQQESYFALRNIGNRWKIFNQTKVNKALENKQIIQQLEKDGLYHLIPFAIVFGMSPEEGKKHLGASSWKKIANNSKTRNNYIFQTGYEFYPEILDLRSGIIAQPLFTGGHSDIIAGRLAPTIADFPRTLHLVEDTRRMCARLQVPFNKNWSLSRFEKEHDKLSKEILAQRFSKEPFGDPHQEVIDGYTFTRLISKFEIAKEGSEMRHCVASYADHAECGRYEVYQVEGRGERATLGIGDVGDRLCLDQLYCYANMAAPKEMHEAAEKLVRKEEKGEHSAGRRSGRASRRGNKNTRTFMDADWLGEGDFPF